jgi:hypothetical protein
MEGKTMHNECWRCQHKRDVPGNAHIDCAKPDPTMTGNSRGIKKGWFYYPLVFDPIWKTRDCVNFDERP